MRLRLASLLSASALATLVALSSCSNEGEGEPCSQQNGNQDCDDGLVCVSPPNMSATNAPYVCCPPPGTAATTSECSTNGQIDAGNPAVPDSSTMPDTSTGHDSAADSTTDAKGDSATTVDTGSGDAGDGGGG